MAETFHSKATLEQHQRVDGAGWELVGEFFVEFLLARFSLRINKRGGKKKCWNMWKDRVAVWQYLVLLLLHFCVLSYWYIAELPQWIVRNMYASMWMYIFMYIHTKFDNWKEQQVAICLNPFCGWDLPCASLTWVCCKQVWNPLPEEPLWGDPIHSSTKRRNRTTQRREHGNLE